MVVRTTLSIYLLFLREVITYGARAWWSLLSTTNKGRLERFQSRTLRSTTGSSWFIKFNIIRQGLRVPPLAVFVRDFAFSLLSKAGASAYTHPSST